MKRRVTSFWDHHPILLYAIFFSLGICFRTEFLWAYLPFCFFLFFTSSKRLIPGILLMTAAFFTTAIDGDFEEKNVEGIFYVDQIRTFRSHFGSGMRYEGSLQDQEKIYPCSAYFTKDPLQSKSARVQGKLTKKGPYRYVLKPKHIKPEEGISLAWKRHKWKQKIQRMLQQNFSKRSSTFFSALFLGETPDIWMKYSFQRMGLSHILAISGFHFALIAYFLMVFF